MEAAVSLVFDVSESNKYPNIAAVEDYLGGIGRLAFEDGTVQFAEHKTYPDVVFSPRLPEQELEVFCKKHLKHYEQYCERLIEAALKKEPEPPIERFWEQSS